jgi:2-keto-4-pentenoate hydratase/2-oxohepta-3-ene-1,7-dioic acid hydratase in catechol pathway
MRLIRFEKDGAKRLGLVRNEEIVAFSDALRASYPSMMSLIAEGENALERVQSLAARGAPLCKLSEARLLAPIERPGKYLAIGMNYRKHVEESSKLGIEEPKRQLWFNKQTSCLSGPFDAIELGVSEQVDYEVELGVVIGRRAKYVTSAEARRHIFGYVVANDVSARDWQFHSPTFTLGKSFDTHGPIGPWLVTADEIPDPENLDLRCWVNDEIRQSSNTCHMIHGIDDQIEYLSSAFTLEPGDLLATGTPEGVGIGMQPPSFLKPGDVVRCQIEHIGTIENRVAATTGPRARERDWRQKRG